MLRPRLLPALLALVLLAAAISGCGDDEDTTTTAATTAPAPDTTAQAAQPSGLPNDIAGDWTGELTQKGLKPFEVAVRIDPDGPTRVAYTGINCGGHWVFKLAGESLPPIYVIDEAIDEGAGEVCKGSGTVTLKPRSKRPPYSELDYDFRGGGVLSQGVLTRTDTAGVDAVFDRAGLQPPG